MDELGRKTFSERRREALRERHDRGFRHFLITKGVLIGGGLALIVFALLQLFDMLYQRRKIPTVEETIFTILLCLFIGIINGFWAWRRNEKQYKIEFLKRADETTNIASSDTSFRGEGK